MDEHILKLYECITDNREKPLYEIQKEMDKLFSEFNPFDHSAKTLQEACGISANKVDTSCLKQKFDKFSEYVEILENSFSKRELAYVVANMSKELEVLSKFSKIIDKFNNI